MLIKLLFDFTRFFKLQNEFILLPAIEGLVLGGGGGGAFNKMYFLIYRLMGP